MTDITFLTQYTFKWCLSLTPRLSNISALGFLVHIPWEAVPTYQPKLSVFGDLIHKTSDPEKSQGPN